MPFIKKLIADYLAALRTGDALELARIEALAADYDAFSSGGPRLLDELAGLHQPAAA